MTRPVARPVTRERTAASAPQRNTVDASRAPSVRKPAVPYENATRAPSEVVGGGYASAAEQKFATSISAGGAGEERGEGGVLRAEGLDRKRGGQGRTPGIIKYCGWLALGAPARFPRALRNPPSPNANKTRAPRDAAALFQPRARLDPG